MQSIKRRRRNPSSAKFNSHDLERLEARQLLSATKASTLPAAVTTALDPFRKVALTVSNTKPTVLPLPTGKNGRVLPAVAGDADIIWTNRGTKNDTNDGLSDGDGFFATFGNKANLARAVVDAVIVSYERMIGSFNYAGGGTFSLTLSMSGGGFGAGASLNTIIGSGLNAKPKSGTVVMGKGNNQSVPSGSGSDQGWFLDPTPFESSEFMGNIQNAFSGDAPSNSPAFNKGDFFTVVAAEMTHCVGQFGSALQGWSSKTTNTGINDAAATGKLWVFRGNSIKHLMTSDNGGTQDAGAAIHSAEPQTITFSSGAGADGLTYIGAQDQGNALYEFSRRYTIDNIHALMFKDAYNYSTVDPAQFGTFYSALNETTKVVTIRGGDSSSGHSPSNDIISITRSGSTITVSVDVGSDVPGTGALPGAGDLPAFVTQYDISQVNSIVLQAGAGNDTISIDANVGVPISFDAGSGSDTLTITGTSAADTLNIVPSGMNGTLSITSMSGLENLVINAGLGDDAISVAPLVGASITVDGGGDNDTLTVTGTSSGDFLNLSSSSLGGSVSVSSFSNIETVTLNTGAGDDGINFGVGLPFTLNIDAGNDNDTLTINGTNAAESFNITASTISGAINVASLSNVETLTVNASGGDDSITVSASASLPATLNLNGGNDNDLITLNGTASVDTLNLAPGSVSGAINANLNEFESQVVNAGGGADAISFDASGAVPSTINGEAGDDTLTITNAGGANPVFVGGADFNTLDLVSGNYTASSDLGAGGTNMAVIVSGAASMTFDSTQHLTNLTINGGASSSATLSSGGTKLLVTGGLTVSNDGTLDLFDNDMIVFFTGGSPLQNIVDSIRTARNGNAWNLPGITSTSARDRAAHNTTLGAMNSSEYTLGSSFDGEPIVGNAVLVKYTYYGDANFNGKVDGADYGRIDVTFNQEHTAGNIGGWANGDFNGDGKVDGQDYGLIDSTFNSQAEVL